MSEMISPDTVRRIAALARLKLNDEEVVQAAGDLTGVLEHFSIIQDIDTTDVPAFDDASGLKNVVRDDVVEKDVHASSAELREKAPAVKEDQVQAPAVFS